MINRIDKYPILGYFIFALIKANGINNFYRGLTMIFKSFKPSALTMSKVKCPDCGSSDDIIRYNGGWCCRDCGTEWG